MPNLLQWDAIIDPALLLLGVGAQCYFVLRPHVPFRLALAGALLVLSTALRDLDSTLLLGQLMILSLLWLWRKKA